MRTSFPLKTASAIAFSLILAVTGTAFAASTKVTLHVVDKSGTAEKAGEVAIEETSHGLVLTPTLSGLRPGGHGFHVHANPDCRQTTDAATGEITPAGAAGGHLDPAGTGRHSLPWDDKGHLGDLPLLFVDDDGNATTPVLAPKLKTLDQIRNRSLMIHFDGDNYSDHPRALGGGGARMACGVIR